MPTLKQKKVAELIVKNKGNVSKSMREAGYSPASAKNPERVTKSKGWNELLGEYIPEETLAKELRALLDSREAKWFTFPTRMKDTDIKKMVEDNGFTVITIRPSPIGKMAWYSLPNSRAKKDALELSFKLLGKFAPEQIELTKRKYQDLSNKDLNELEQTLVKFLLKK